MKENNNKKEDKSKLSRILNALENHLFGVVIGAVILNGVGNWTHDMYSTHKSSELEKMRIEKVLELKTGDYNHNKFLDKYYEIDSVKVPYEVDGNPISSYFKK